jgi:superfamily I DNA and/or RNA helicase
LIGAAKECARMFFVECPSPEDFGHKSKSNEGQANLCRDICRRLYTTTKNIEKHGSPSVVKQLIAVLTPYSRQVDLLKQRLSEFAGLEVSSIDGFQGREADIVVFVTVRCNVHCEIGFLKDLRRLNVALTRARVAVIVIGHRQTLTTGLGDSESKAIWTRLLKQLEEVKL